MATDLAGSGPGFSARFDRALRVAALVHRGQLRKGTHLPYLMHPVHVAAILARHGYPEPVQLAALLHDTIEDLGEGDADSLPDLVATFRHELGDGPATRDALRPRLEAFLGRAFGPDVLTLVRAVTEEKRDARDRPIAWGLRKAATLSRLGDPRLPTAAVALKAADVLHNAQSIARDVQEHGGSIMARFTGTPGETLAFYRGVVHLVDQRVGAGHPLAGEVRAAVEALAATLEAGR